MDGKGEIATENITPKKRIYAALTTSRQDYIDKLAYGRLDADTRFHGICYTLTITNAYNHVALWPESNIQHSRQYQAHNITIRVFPNDTVTIYIAATNNPLTTKKMAELDQYLDTLLQFIFNTKLQNYEIAHIECNHDIINATLKTSTIEIPQKHRLFRIYQKTISNIPRVRIETRYTKPLTITPTQLKPFITNTITSHQLRVLQQQIDHVLQQNTIRDQILLQNNTLIKEQSKAYNRLYDKINKSLTSHTHTSHSESDKRRHASTRTPRFIPADKLLRGDT